RDVPGKPEMFGTTREFLDYFGLKKLEDLPPLAELKDGLVEFGQQADLIESLEGGSGTAVSIGTAEGANGEASAEEAQAILESAGERADEADSEPESDHDEPIDDESDDDEHDDEDDDEDDDDGDDDDDEEDDDEDEE